MTKPRLTLACAPYDRTLPLFDGRVQAQGIDLNVLLMRQEDVFWRMIRHREFDISEMSLSSYFMMHASGSEEFLAIPVFPSRVFRHGSIFVRADAGIEKPTDLAGRAVGVPEYQMTAAVWIRGMLQHQYGVDIASIRWFNGGLDEPGRVEKLPLALPSHISLRAVDPTVSLTGALRDGALDAIITARPPRMFAEGDPRIRRLFPDYKREEIAYYRQTSIFPPMHTVVFRREVLRRYPWAAKSVFDAFSSALKLCSKEVVFHGHSSYALPFIEANLEEVAEVFGEHDPWAYGFAENEATLRTLIEHQHEHGLIPDPFDPSTAFAEATLDESKN